MTAPKIVVTVRRAGVRALLAAGLAIAAVSAAAAPSAHAQSVTRSCTASGGVVGVSPGVSLPVPLPSEFPYGFGRCEVRHGCQATLCAHTSSVKVSGIGSLYGRANHNARCQGVNGCEATSVWLAGPGESNHTCDVSTVFAAVVPKAVCTYTYTTLTP
jgi:hypothetical protein